MDHAGQRVVVMGLGRFGGGVGATRYLVRQGADVLVTDLEPAERLRDGLRQLDGLPGVDYRLGEHNVADFTTADLIVANPAVRPDNRFLRAAKAAGVPVTSEIRLLVAQLPDRKKTIGVTGTAGKSTTAAMIAHVLNKPLSGRPAGPRVWLGGNIGGSLLEHLDEIGKDDWVVLELSSFMLHGLREDQWSPHIAVITNISPNHLDWHGSYEAYMWAKQGILDFQHEGDAVALGPELDRIFRAEFLMVEVAGVNRNWFPQLKLPGMHNKVNAMIVTGTLFTAKLLPSNTVVAVDELLADFHGLPHRLQFVAERGGVRFYNDSKSTTPEAAMRAIEAFEPGTVHVILGGYDKGADLTPLAGLAAQRCAGVYTIGATGDAIARAAEAALPREAKIVRCETLDRAVAEAASAAVSGNVVLLSPGCASWDRFDNYEQRGEHFTKLIAAADPPTTEEPL